MMLSTMMLAQGAGQGAEATGLSDPRLWLLFSLLILVGVAIWKKLPALLARALDERAEGIAKELAEARRLREEAQELLASYERRQREAEKEAEAIIAQAKKEAGLLASEATQKLHKVLERRVEAAKRKIAQAETRAAADVRAHAAALAVETAKITLPQALGKTAQTKLIDEGIKEAAERL